MDASKASSIWPNTGRKAGVTRSSAVRNLRPVTPSRTARARKMNAVQLVSFPDPQYTRLGMRLLFNLMIATGLLLVAPGNLLSHPIITSAHSTFAIPVQLFGS